MDKIDIVNITILIVDIFIIFSYQKRNMSVKENLMLILACIMINILIVVTFYF